MLRIILIFAMLSLTSLPASASETDLIEFLREELDDLRDDLDAQEAAPDEGSMLTKVKNDYQDDIDKILDKAIKHVAPDTFDVYAKQIDRISEARKDAEAKRAELLLQRIEASTSEGVGMVSKALGREYERGSVEDIDGRISELDQSLVQLDKDKEAVTAGFSRAMAEKHGVTISDAQALAILYSVNGSILVDATVILGALSEVEQRLGQITSQSIGAEAQRDYIGVASATRLIHARLLRRHLEQYDGKWLPELSDMHRETELLLTKTKSDAANAKQDSVRATYVNNIAVQERILSVIDRYGDMLERRRKLTADALILAEERADAAVNTLRTLETAAGLSAIIAESTANYEKIMEIELPELEQFDTADFEEMLDISRRLTS